MPGIVLYVMCLQLFNLFSLYGIVLRIKILKERPDTALIQYSSPFYATIAQCLMMVNLLTLPCTCCFARDEIRASGFRVEVRACVV